MGFTRMPGGQRPLSRTLFLPALMVLVVALPACTRAGAASVGARQRSAVTTTTVAPFAPLTGLPGDARLLARPAVMVKIESSPAARPQAGLDKADVVFEEIAEGGATRFLAVFHSADSDAGPIRSVRPTDPAILSPFGGVIAYSGGIPRFVAAVRAAPVTAIDEDHAGRAFRRRTDKVSPHNLYGMTDAIRGLAGPGSKPPPQFATFLARGQVFQPPGATAVSGADVVVGSVPVGYTWDGASGTWKRTTNGTAHLVEGGAQVAPTTVIVQFVSYLPTGEVDTAGSPVLEGKVTGTGDAVILAGGKSVAARWSKPSATSMTTFTDRTGAPIAIPAGRTWVELAAVGASVVPRVAAPPTPPTPPTTSAARTTTTRAR